MTAFVMAQLQGKKRILRLEDHYAPHGRPQKGEIFALEPRVREDEVYYAGNDVPTTHEFGMRYEPLQLHGTFTDRYGGKGFAEAKHAEVRDFFDERQPVSMIWGNLLNARGKILVYKAAVEAGSEIPWEMTIRIDQDLTLGVQRKEVRVARQPKALIRDAINQMDQDLANMQELPPTLRGSVFDAIDTLVSDINQIGASVLQVADQIDDVVNAPLHQLRRLRGGLRSFRTAITRLRDTYDNLKVDAALESREIRDAHQLFDVQAAWSVSSLEAIGAADRAEREAVLSERGRTLAYYSANQGDTWESIATQFYGGPENAGKISDANGIDSGDPPTPGEVYLIPRAA